MEAKWHIVPAQDHKILWGPPVTGWIGEVGPFVSQYVLDFVGNGLHQRSEEVSGNASNLRLQFVCRYVGWVRRPDRTATFRQFLSVFE